jgi:hypothetical protein
LCVLVLLLALRHPLHSLLFPPLRTPIRLPPFFQRMSLHPTSSFATNAPGRGDTRLEAKSSSGVSGMQKAT